MNPPIKSIIISAFGKGRDPEARQKIISELSQSLPRDCSISITPNLRELAPTLCSCPLESFDGDLIVVLGGDGSMLQAASIAVYKQIPLIGINLGRLGFLTDLSQENAVSSINEILQGNYITANRVALNWSVEQQSGIAINDIVITHRQAVHIIETNLMIDQNPVYQQKGDGLLVCTPTGSTAYHLSAGGSILSPALSCFGILSLNPHRLNSKPMIISDHHTLTLQAHHDETILWSDGQSLPIGRKLVTLTKHPKPLPLIHPKSYCYTDILQRKLGWEIPYAPSN